ncbi:MAG: UPF0182 family protein [Firmicutes bacterium]|nr:UPF0182 family protein [Bacillota bacterium]
MKRQKTKTIVFLAVVLILLGFTALVNFLTDYLWFKELQYVSVFFKKLLTQLKIGVPVFILLTSACYIYLQKLKKNYYSKVLQVVSNQTLSERRLNQLAMLISAVFSLLVTINVVGRLWFQILQFINSTDFGIADPVFHRDLSFYVFKLDFLANINGSLVSIILGFAAVIFFFYLLLLSARKPHIIDSGAPPPETSPFGDNIRQMFGGGPAQDRERQNSTINKNSMRKLISLAANPIKVLGALLFLAVGFHFYLQRFTLLYAGSSGVVYGAGFTDINITLWVYRLLMLMALAGAAMFVWGMQKRSWKKAFIMPAAMVAVLILGSIAAASIQSLVVAPDEISKEYNYLQNNISFTRSAYNLQDIDIRNFAATNNLQAADIANNLDTITNIRINDFEPAEKFYNQTQSIRLYYKFNDVDVDRYQINDEYTQVFLSAREIDENATTDQWLTQHLKYTHGYGITLSRVDKVTESGQPDMLIKGIPPVSSVQEIQIERPEIYFGETTDNYIVVNTDEQEFDYPSGDANVYTTYDGNAGIRLNFLNRLLFSMREGSLKLLVSTNIDSESKIIINRKIMDRVYRIAPFLHYDDDPYIVAAGGKLYWMIDAYTASSYYPYSEPYSNKSDVNYIRNSVKIVIDAYNGDTGFYVVDEEDPIAQTLKKIYPALFKSFAEMPEELQAHIRYPITMFNIQAKVYSKYHMTDVNSFYQNEDAWNIATEVYGTETVTMVPRYYIMKLPNEKDAEFITSVPYTPSGKYNMTALLVGRNDGEHYGDLILFQLPKDRTIYGPQQIESQINQHTKIAQDFTLWSSAGSIYSRGNLFVIPIEDSLMYVEPIYLESASSSLPEVKRVVVYYNERIAYADTLANALGDMFGDEIGTLLSGGDYRPAGDGSDGTKTEADGLSTEEIAQLAKQAYDDAIQAQRDGNWAAYGRYLDQLAGYLQRLLPEDAGDGLAETTGGGEAAPVGESLPETPPQENALLPE